MFNVLVNPHLLFMKRRAISCIRDLRGPKDQIRSTAFLHFFPCSSFSSWALSPVMSSSILGLMSTFFLSLREMFNCSRV